MEDRHKTWRTSPNLWRKLQSVSRRLRGEPTPAESVLWERLRGKQLLGLRFRRQHPIGRCVVDFFCPENQFVIELDGPVHDSTQEEDLARQAYLEEFGLTVLRIKNAEVLHNLTDILQEIAKFCGRSQSQNLPTTDNP